LHKAVLLSYNNIGYFFVDNRKTEKELTSMTGRLGILHSAGDTSALCGFQMSVSAL
jgi:hypothetical protein